MATIDELLEVRERNSAVIDVEGKLHISYVDETGERLRYARFFSEVEELETIDTGLILFSSHITLDDQGRPHLAYHKRTADGLLMYAYRSGSGWIIQTAGSGSSSFGGFCDLVLNAAGHPYISFNGDDPEELLCAFYSGFDWQFSVVDELDLDPTTSIALDKYGRPVIAYTDDDWEYIYLNTLLD
jgi:hypothetical protein